MLKKLILLLVIAIALTSGLRSGDFSKYVDPMIGTGGHGHTYPGPCAPFGMVQLSPDTRLTGWDGCSAYHYSDNVIHGFSHTHLSGTGCSDYGDILFMPGINPMLADKLPDFKGQFKHENEKALAGSYSVKLDNGINIELTASTRAGFHKYTFPVNKPHNVLIDLKHRDSVLESEIFIINDSTVAGYRRSYAWARDQYVYFYAIFSKSIQTYNVFRNDTLLKEANRINDRNLKAVLNFDNTDEVMVKVGISATSIQGAKKNLLAEIPVFDFNAIRNKTISDWDNYLGRVEISASPNNMKTYYTALYHAAIVPNIYSDVDGSYRGRDMQVHKGDFDYYTVFSLWDTYRAYHPFMTIIDQKRTNDFIKTFIEQFRQGGRLPVWELSANETDCMIGYHAVPVIADAMVKGIKDYDLQEAWEAVRQSSINKEYRGIGHYLNYGFLPVELEGESVSKTLEYAYDDYCIAQISKQLGNEYYGEYIKRAQYYKNLFNPETGFMRARYNGSWYKPFDPYEVNNNYTEANSWQYSFYAPQDMTTLISLYGGKGKFAARLDELFSARTKTSGREQSDISGLIGQYAHGNEPSHHIAYLYNYAGMPWKTQEVVYKICQTLYSPEPDGLCGNEDCGQMSAWYLFSALGFYPVCPGDNNYIIGTPGVEKAIINLENGKKFTVIAQNYSKKNIYIQSAKLNGAEYNKSYINHDAIMTGGELVFTMGAVPNKAWASNDESIPLSQITESLIAPAPYIVNAPRSFRDSLKLNIECLDKSASIFYAFGEDIYNGKYIEYTEPITIFKSCKMAFYSESKGKEKSGIMDARFALNQNNFKVKVLSKYSTQYTAGGDEGLIDGIRGEENWKTGSWQGHNNGDLVAVIDMGSIKPIKKAGAGFLQDVGAWIWMPKTLEISVSIDGKNFKKVQTVTNPIAEDDRVVQMKELIGVFSDLKARYIKFVGKSIGSIPAWHPGAGEQGLIFVDELIVE